MLSEDHAKKAIELAYAVVGELTSDLSAMCEEVAEKHGLDYNDIADMIVLEVQPPTVQ